MKMLRKIAAAVMVVMLLAAPARAVDDYDDSQSNPFRIIAYVLHPIGYAVEWLFTRPFYRLVSQDDLEPIFGHVPHEGFDYESYSEGLSTGVAIGGNSDTIAERSHR
ncbi:MAG: hypothetical protein P8K76_12165 [Candidatus Binatia bacterium]|nr:hypothetical protein [Candidatus Binatia bacterium]MDG2010530.1 hypothetical protein [Candidatus Binatia bacterium]HAC80495.1 hypothetical protein [Deltaproteobacteria bacterium]